MEWYTIVGLVVQSTIWVVILLFLSIWVSVNLYESCCCCLRRRSRLLPWAAAGAGSSTASGLGPPEIEKLPTFTYPKVEGDASVKMSRGITECAVCLAAFKEAETLRLIPVCGHVFHADCVDVWLRSHSTCPCCRASLRAEPDVETGDVALSPV